MRNQTDQTGVNAMDKTYLNKREAAEYLRVSVNTIDNLRNRGVLKFRKLGRQVLFTREMLDAATKVDGGAE